MKVDGKHTRSIWLEPDGWSVGIIDQTLLPHRFATVRLDDARRRRARHRDHAGARRAADRRDRGLRRLPGAARRRLRRGARARLCDAAGHAADRDQSQMGARRDDGGGAQPPARGARRRRLSARGRDLRRGCRHQPGDRPPRRRADRGDRRRKKPGAAGQRAHPLQCRLARDRRLRHRDWRRSTWRTTAACRSMSGSTRRGRATRALRSPPGNSASTACRTP